MGWNLLEILSFNGENPTKQTISIPAGARYFRFKAAFTQTIPGMYGEIQEFDVGTVPQTLVRSTRWNFRGNIAQWEAPDSGLLADRRLVIKILPTGIDFTALVSVEYALGVNEQTLSPLTISLLGAEEEGEADRARDEAIAAAQDLVNALTAADVGADPVGSASAAQGNAIAFSQNLVDGLTAVDVGADPVGSASAAQQNAIAFAQGLIDALTAADVGADPAGAALAAQQNAIAFAQGLIDALTAADVGADPAGAALAAQQNAITQAQSLASTAQSNAITQAQTLASTAQANAITQAQTLASTAQANAITQAQTLASTAQANAITQAQTLAATAQTNAINQAEVWMPIDHTHWWGYEKRISGAALTRNRNATSRFAYIAYQSPAVVGDELEFSFILKKGDYRLDIIGIKQSDLGIAEFFLNEVSISQLDFYAAVAASFVTVVEVAFASSGLQKFRSKVTGKNAASTGYFLYLVGIIIYPRY